MSICEEVEDKSKRLGFAATIKTAQAGGRVRPERKKTPAEIRRMKSVGGGKMEPVGPYKPRKDIGSQRDSSTRQQQPEQERGSARERQLAAAKAERAAAASTAASLAVDAAFEATAYEAAFAVSQEVLEETDNSATVCSRTVNLSVNKELSTEEFDDNRSVEISVTLTDNSETNFSKVFIFSGNKVLVDIFGLDDSRDELNMSESLENLFDNSSTEVSNFFNNSGLQPFLKDSIAPSIFSILAYIAFIDIVNYTNIL